MFKKLLITLSLCISYSLAQAGWTNYTLTHDATTREYRLYVPDGYSAAQPAVLIVALHGLGGSMTDIELTGMQYIADTANIILAAPQALDFDSPLGVVEAAWNSGIVVNVTGLGAIAVNGEVDDTGFIAAMMDSVTAHYSINPDRQYVCGFSMGGFMTQRLSCEMSVRFAAAASLAGTYALALPECTPEKLIPVAHFHGTDDSVVTYEGFTPFPVLGLTPVGLSVPELVTQWTLLHACTGEPVEETFADANGDGLSMDHYIYKDAEGKDKVELFRVNGAAHLWYNYAMTENEFDYSNEVWKFFNRQYAATSIDKVPVKLNFSIAPNPVEQTLNIHTAGPLKNLSIYDPSGRRISIINQPGSQVDVRSLLPGIYLLEVITNEGLRGYSRFVKK